MSEVCAGKRREAAHTGGVKWGADGTVAALSAGW